MHDHSPVRERIITDGDQVRVILQQECDGIIDGVKAVASVSRRSAGANVYLGSVPRVVAEIWAGECKAPLGSREFAEYGKKKLMSGDFNKLRAFFT